MSGDYASRLKEYHHKGVCGLPETTESKRALLYKVAQLTQLIQNAQRVVVITGAGISTAAGIPDFRGPKGIWTLEKKQKKAQAAAKRAKHKRKRNDDAQACIAVKKPGTISPTTAAAVTPAATASKPMDFSSAKPTLTHRALYYLWKKNVIHFLITQNVDGLHRRSGFDRSALAILHGCVFTEKCEACGREYFRDTEVPGISFQRTGKKCTDCDGYLRDTLLDWCDHLPEDDWDRCNEVCESADLVVTLGTSLRMEPCASLVKLAKQYVVVNLQETPYDDKAALVIRYKVDELLPMVLARLGFPENWEEEYSCPTIQETSLSLCPVYASRWWKTPTDDGSDDKEDNVDG